MWWLMACSLNKGCLEGMSAVGCLSGGKSPFRAASVRFREYWLVIVEVSQMILMAVEGSAMESICKMHVRGSGI